MAVSVTLTLTDAQYTALTWEASRYQVTPESRLRQVLDPSLEECCRRYDDTKWQERRRILEANPKLAAQVDRAAE